MAEVKLAIYKTPTQADAIGRTITDTVTLSESEASVFVEYYNSLEEGSGAAFGSVVGLAVSLVTKSLAPIFGFAIDFAAGYFTATHFTSYYGQLANKFDLITNDHPSKFKVTYTYRRHGSNDGAYWITNIEATN